MKFYTNMKKVILLVAAAALTLSASAQSLKFAHVNYSELVQLTPEADEARAKLSAQSKEIDETYQSMVEEFNTKLSAYQQKSSTWTDAVRQSKESELSEIQQRIQEFQQTAQQELSQSQQSLMAPIQKKVQDTINSLAKAGGYVYVMEVGSLLYVDDTKSTDLTPAARKALGIAEGRTLETLQQELQAQAQAEADAAAN